MNKKVDVSRIQKGEVLSETQYYTVKNVIKGPQSNDYVVNVVNERGYEFGISGGIVEEGMHSATQFDDSEKVNRTQMTEIFAGVGDTVFTVCYRTQPKKEEIASVIGGLNKGKFPTTAEIAQAVGEVYKGRERILTGYLVNSETGLGRSTVIDLNLERGDNANYDGRLRQVDHRTIEWLVFKGVKYYI